MEVQRFNMILFGILTLIFASIYMIIVFLFVSFPIEDPWLWFVGIFSCVMFIFGLVLMGIVIITPDRPIIGYSGGILTFFFGGLFTAFSIFPLILSPFGYAVVLAVIFVITALIFLAAARRYYAQTGQT